MSGPKPDCTDEYKRDCACWRCLRHFHLQVCAMIFDHERRMRERELLEPTWVPISIKQDAA